MQTGVSIEAHLLKHVGIFFPEIIKYDVWSEEPARFIRESFNLDDDKYGECQAPYFDWLVKSFKMDGPHIKWKWREKLR